MDSALNTADASMSIKKIMLTELLLFYKLNVFICDIEGC